MHFHFAPQRDLLRLSSAKEMDFVHVPNPIPYSFPHSSNACSRPRVQLAILKELETIRIRNGKSIGDTYSFDELRDMHYLHAAISEAMRLYPPVSVYTKACLNDDVIPDGTIFKKGWFVTYHA
ncbi:Hypothetical predicted protein [Prunus dulcis]|uniref:Uncharacterized protein n=1 Tax=Prunus dulcis TaxID=3755 RepID=A0A5E4F066_PRUDU|nr:hypothetical protein L3X38_029792 [Prunus dulcis]VVA21445.1 Hypothetical predicted protein [Prunus dulcis]